MYFLGINGSYREKGLDEKMLNILKEEFEKQGNSFEILNLIEFDIKRCEACLLEDMKLCTPERCFKLNDDFKMVVDKIKQSSGIVFATPVHWYAPSAIMWNLIERMTSLENTRSKILQGKPFSVISAAAEDGAQSAITQMIVPLIHAGMILVPFGMTYYSGKEEDKETEEYLKRIVKNMIYLGKQKDLKSHDWW